jgi:alkylation response protein AidB-like acyl-CoA dehydrogenase
VIRAQPRMSSVLSIFGGTTEIMKEIIGRGLGLQSDQAFYEARAAGS